MCFTILLIAPRVVEKLLALWNYYLVHCGCHAFFYHSNTKNAKKKKENTKKEVVMRKCFGKVGPSVLHLLSVCIIYAVINQCICIM